MTLRRLGMQRHLWLTTALLCNTPCISRTYKGDIMSKAKRGEVLQIRLTKAEISQVRKAAAGIPLSTFARFRLLGAALTVPALLDTSHHATVAVEAKKQPLRAIPLGPVERALTCKLCGAAGGHKPACPSAPARDLTYTPDA